ncbi:MAG: YfiR family protein, partial [bacterium]|nr:YfiR family protein [bacterium]
MLERSYSTRKMKNKTVVIQYLDSIEQLDAKKCHMLFISHSMEKDLDKIITKIWKKPILTVSDTPGFAKRGV